MLIFKCVSRWHRQKTVFYLVFLFEAIALPCLHLVDVLEQVCHSDGRVELPRVVGRALPSTLVPRGASEQTAGFIHRTTSVTWTNDKHTYRFSEVLKIKKIQELTGCDKKWINPGNSCMFIWDSSHWFHLCVYTTGVSHALSVKEDIIWKPKQFLSFIICLFFSVKYSE